MLIKPDSGASFYRYMKEKVVMKRVRGVKGGAELKGGLRVRKRGFTEEERVGRKGKLAKIAPDEEFMEGDGE